MQNDWWRGTSVYQIYPRSFFDSNRDGIGDLQGIISQIDYIKKAGFETIWLSPFFASPQRDFGYDISDYRSIAPEYGTMADVERLIEEVHSRKMYIIFDMVLNHTSDEHPWFKEARSSKDNPKRNWYIWQDGKPGHGGKQKPPNNWRSQVSGSGWQYDMKTNQWYWAAFLPFQPDLNYRNPEVKEEIFSILEYWLKKGVDGFRLDIIGSIYEDAGFRDSPFIWKLFPDEDNDGMLFQSSCRTQNLPESIDFTHELRELTDRFSKPERFMVGETFGRPKEIAKFCKDGGLHSAFAFKCTAVPFTAADFRKLLIEYEESFPEPLVPVWAFSNHDRTRRISGLGGSTAKARLNAAFQITARGIPFFYYGEEAGMTDAQFKHRDSRDPVSFPFKGLPAFVFKLLNNKVHGALNRDCVRTPMQWDSGPNAGFCAADVTPWLPVSMDARTVNSAAAAADPDSIYNCIKRFLSFRAGSEVLRFGTIKLIDEDLLPTGVLGFYRESENGGKLAVLLNFRDKKAYLERKALELAEPVKLMVSTRAETTDLGEIIELSAYEGIIAGS